MKISSADVFIENSGNYIAFCPEFSNGQFQRTCVLINRIVHIRRLLVKK